MNLHITPFAPSKLSSKYSLQIFTYQLSENQYNIAVSQISAGFPAYAENFKTDPISIDKVLVSHPESTFIIQVSGESMTDAGIFPNSYIVVDTSLKPKDKSIVVARYGDDFLVKRLHYHDDFAVLKAENSLRNFPDIRLDSETDFEIWGVVVGEFKRF
jgi:DNA polymerase V